MQNCYQLSWVKNRHIQRICSSVLRLMILCLEKAQDAELLEVGRYSQWSWAQRRTVFCRYISKQIYRREWEVRTRHYTNQLETVQQKAAQHLPIIWSSMNYSVQRAFVQSICPDLPHWVIDISQWGRLKYQQHTLANIANDAIGNRICVYPHPFFCTMLCWQAVQIWRCRAWLSQEHL